MGLLAFAGTLEGRLTPVAFLRNGTMPTITEPLHLTPILVSKPWGGRRLVSARGVDGGRGLTAGSPVGERWEVADLPAADASGVARPCTAVTTGPFAGRSLADLIALDRDALLGTAADLDGRFPLLLKVLDVREALSVQVHPPEAYVARHPDVALKTETWVVLDADPGAEVMAGLVEGVTLAQVREVVGTPELPALLRHQPAVVGAVHHLPAGTIHAVGGGALLAEVQTPSDTTFRLYDWAYELGRAPRTLHLEDGLEALELAVAGEQQPSGGFDSLPLDAGSYQLDRHHLDVEVVRDLDAGTLRVIHVVEGSLVGDGFAWPVGAGATVVLPAAWGGTLRADLATTWLEVTLPPDDRRG